jgi:hypothetical protein
MPEYVKGEIPGAGKLYTNGLKGVSQASCGVLGKMGAQIQWVHSYITGDKVYYI